MTNPYPANFEALDGSRRLTGQVNFTDPANQPSGSQSGNVVPVADPTGVTVDATTYDDPISGSGKLTTLVFPVNQGAIAIAIAGDAFPRWLMAAHGDDGLYIGDGTFDPYTGPAITCTIGPTTKALLLEGKDGNFQVGSNDTNAGGYNISGNPLQLEAGAFLSSGSGAPALGGHVGDLYIRSDGADGSWIYRCTVAGGAGAATWVAKL